MQAAPAISPCTDPLRVLLVTTLRWPLAARLAVAFGALGCVVEVWCPRGHPVEAVATVRRLYRCGALFQSRALRSAIQCAEADLIIPCDDAATRLLCGLHRTSARKPGNAALRAIIGKSLGQPRACEGVSARQQLLELARECALRTPESCALESAHDLETWAARQGFPTVLKVDHSCGGQGVLIVHDAGQAREAYRLATHPSWRLAVRDLILRRNPMPLLDRLRGTRPAVSAHQFIRGVPANRAVACWQGHVLAGVSALAVATQGDTGPATVVKLSANADMAASTETLVARIGLSGLCGLDFIIEAGSGAAYLIEMNPRATPTCHLALGAGFDMPAALVAQLRGSPQPAAAPAPLHERIAMFPGEWRRDPFSPHLKSAHHDVPWQEEALVRECIALPWEARGLAARIRDRFRSKQRLLAAPFPSMAARADSAASSG